MAVARWGALVLAGLLGAPSSAAAQLVEARVVSAPAQAAVGQREPLVFTLALRAGARPVRFAVQTSPNGQFGNEDFPIALRGGIELGGDAVYEGGFGRFATTACSPTVPLHGEEGHDESANVWLRADGQGTVTARYAVSATPPWGDLDYRPRFDIAASQADPALAALRPADGSFAPQTVLPPAIAVAGRRGVRITFETIPATVTGGGKGGLPTLAPGTVLAVRGTTDPPVSRVVLTDQHDYAVRDVAAAPADADGRFVLRWQPVVAGYHEVGVIYRADRPDLANDYACVHSYRVGESGQAPPAAPAPRLAVRSRAVRPTRAGAARLTVACPAEHWRRCDGALQLRAAGARSPRAAYSVRAGRRAHVVLRLRGARTARTAVVETLPADGDASARTRLRVRPSAVP